MILDPDNWNGIQLGKAIRKGHGDYSPILYSTPNAEEVPDLATYLKIFSALKNLWMLLPFLAACSRTGHGLASHSTDTHPYNEIWGTKYLHWVQDKALRARLMSYKPTYVYCLSSVPISPPW